MYTLGLIVALVIIFVLFVTAFAELVSARTASTIIGLALAVYSLGVSIILIWVDVTA
jgi:hypothetical protein